jgi:putative protease
MVTKPELLSPAGTLKNMRYAFAYGADAIYAGQPRYSLRVRNNEFTNPVLADAIAEAHARGKQFYVVSNIQAHNSKIKTYLKDIEPIIEMQPDALIMSDPGLIMLVREHFPDQPIHLSVQANAVNWAAVKFWHSVGIERVVLSRELSIEEIAEIRQQVPECELEVFVHGALCIAYSGRCLLSGYINKRDANQGTCTNACRWKYNTFAAEETETGDVVPVKVEQISDLTGTTSREQPVMVLEEEGRPGEFMPAFEDEHGTYIMNSKDLRAVELVPELVNIGVHSLKIEGRTKSHFYVARTAQVYRRAIDDAVAGKPIDPQLIRELDSLANRGYTLGFLKRHVHSDYQNYEQGASSSDYQRFVGEVVDASDAWLEIEAKNKFCVGDELEIMTPAGNLKLKLDAMWHPKTRERMECAKGSGYVARIPNPFKGLSDEVLRYALVMRFESWG